MKKHPTSPSIRVLKRINKIKKFLYEENPDLDNHFISLLIFLFFADSLKILSESASVFDLLSPYKEDPKAFKNELERIIQILRTPLESRTPEEQSLDLAYLDLPVLSKDLFFPNFNKKATEITFEVISEHDFKTLPVAIFCSSFEDNLASSTKHSGGSYFTDDKVINRVIGPLFIENLEKELEGILNSSENQEERLKSYLERLSSFKVLDPACGSGNFLVESYIALRRLENKALIHLGEEAQISVTPDQFFGVEINPAVDATIKTAFFLAEAQQRRSLEESLKRPFQKSETEPDITYDNALRISWEILSSGRPFNYIIGNPPFIGARLMNRDQKQDLLAVFGTEWANTGNLDYSASWFKKAYDYMKESPTETAFVVTNSLFQGESVQNLWEPLISSGLIINFAYPCFRWNTKTDIKSQAFCAVAGVSFKDTPRRLYSESDTERIVENINGNLAAGENIFLKSRTRPLCDVPRIGIGNKPVDGGNYIFTQKEYEDFIKEEPGSKKYFRSYYGSTEFVKNRPRYCLYLGKASEQELKKLPKVWERVEVVRKFREKSKSISTRKIADTPTLFHVEHIPEDSYLLIPRVSTSKRDYIPIGFMRPEQLASDSVHLIDKGTLFHLGILSSKLHMDWVRRVAGRFGNGYRYSKDIVYNNFPWPDLTQEERSEISESAFEILKARSRYPETPLEKLYTPEWMPEDLKAAHRRNDLAVLKAYGLNRDISEEETVEHLMGLYKTLIEKEAKELTDN